MPPNHHAAHPHHVSPKKSNIGAMSLVTASPEQEIKSLRVLLASAEEKAYIFEKKANKMKAEIVSDLCQP